MLVFIGVLRNIAILLIYNIDYGKNMLESHFNIKEKEKLFLN